MISQALITSVITAKLFVQFVVGQQRPLGCRGQPIGLIDDDWPYPFATGHWRVDIGASGDPAHLHQDGQDVPKLQPRLGPTIFTSPTG